MISIGAPLFLLGGLIGFWVFRKKEMPVRIISGVVCGCAFVGFFILAVVLGGDR